MKTIALTFIAVLFAADALATEIPIPKRVQKRILAAAPEIDLNNDGKITAEELKAGRDKLPENMLLLDVYPRGHSMHCTPHSAMNNSPTLTLKWLR
ncbi:EF-hand domain-containing protein [Stieleria varia]|uniref:EF-hand domain-containing protein n=1 Tax=Stieleria varia TaxID=2528005 RepID=A0A5C6AZK5_9BACT|nr:EF-hand domain-containing protein [Stieleria varia]TWU04781.1 hypothetical protein Pla52n_28250 [Stieleria varia]